MAYILKKYYCAIIKTNALSCKQQHVVQHKCVYTRRLRTLICQPIIILLILLSYRVITDSLNVNAARYYCTLFCSYMPYEPQMMKIYDPCDNFLGEICILLA